MNKPGVILSENSETQADEPLATIKHISAEAEMPLTIMKEGFSVAALAPANPKQKRNDAQIECMMVQLLAGYSSQASYILLLIAKGALRLQDDCKMRRWQQPVVDSETSHRFRVLRERCACKWLQDVAAIILKTNSLRA